MEIDKILRGPEGQPGKFPSRVLFVAAELGNTEFIVELIRKYPDLIWKKDDRNQSIFHTAVSHRHVNIYNLVYEIGSMKDSIVVLKDPDENSMLHLVGKMPHENRWHDVTGAAFQLQHQLLWYKEVESMIPSYRKRKNRFGQTPHQLFTHTHKDLVMEGGKWMKGTASKCMVVSALIATIVFAVAYTIPEFIRALETRFGPSTYENHQATLFKLRQTSTVALYQTEFERISNCVTGLSNEALWNFFISGLRSEIQSEMALHNPTTLHQTYGLAKVIEDKLSSNRSRFNQSPRYFSNSTSNPLKPPLSTPTNPSTPHNNSTTAHTTTSSILPNPKPCTPLPFSRLSPEALQKRRAEGLCFRCPEKYHPCHVCTPPQFLLIAGNECESESDVIPDSGFFHIEDTSPEHTEIPTANEFQTPHFLALSDAAYFGLKSPRAVRVTGYIQGQPVTVLVDCGSTHNIIQPRIASLLTMAPTKINPFPVMVGNGQFLECNSLYPSTPLDINKTQFHVPLFVNPVTGADVVLGLAWLSSLGTIIADFAIPQLSFTFNNKQITLRGEPFSSPEFTLQP
nr:ankyrin repeat-containing protein [Tanacetum cinerariifolium]